MTEKDNFIYLLTGLIFLLFSGACVDQFMSGLGQSLVLVATIITMISGIWSIRSTSYLFNTGLGLLFATVIISMIVLFLDKEEYEFIHTLLLLCFFVLTLKPAVEQALFAGQVTSNSIIGSICIFLLLGLIWAMLYLLLAEFIPDSFSGIEVTNWKQNFSDFVYFSFVTLTTLGFGDLLPVSPIARFLVYMEAVVGVFYMAIVVSSLVGAKMSEAQANNNNIS